jgi:hypothetical protein
VRGKMWETRSVSQGVFIVVISSAAYGCELSWRAVCKRRVRPALVIVVDPEFQLPSGIGQAEQHLHVQALIAIFR